MKTDEVILERQSVRTRFRNGDMDFMYNWQLGISEVVGMSASQIHRALAEMRDGDPDGWRNGFRRQGDQLARAAEAEGEIPLVAGQFSMGAAHAYRAALQYTTC